MLLFALGFIVGGITTAATLYTIGAVMISKMASRPGSADADMQDRHATRN